MGGLRSAVARTAGLGMTSSEYWRSGLFKAGVLLLVFGTGPLLFIIVAAAIGLWPDPNPNPVGPGLLAGLTFWPGLICLIVGISRVRRDNKGAI
jgi:hypothetical protein